MVEIDAVLEVVRRRAQQTIGPVPVVVLGSGASADHGLPLMGHIANHLQRMELPENTTEEQTAIWNSFLGSLETTDLESALNKVDLSEDIHSALVLSTRALFSKADEETMLRILSKADRPPLSALLRRLFDSTHMSVDVITTNYDRVVEYAANVSGFSFSTGFSFGALRRRESEKWKAYRN